MIAVPSELKVSNVREFIAFAKAKPDALNFGSPGRLTSVYLLSEEFKVRAGINMLHVPYRGGPQVTQGLMTNEVLVAVPLFIFMGVILERSGIAEALLLTMGKLFGNGPQLWLNMQAAYDTWHAEREVDVSKIPTIKAA